MQQPPAATPKATERRIRFEHSRHLAELLAQIRSSLIVSTYQAGKVAVIGSYQSRLTLSFHNFDRPMGVATGSRRSMMAVAARDRVWMLRNARDIAAQLEPHGHYDNLFVTRSAAVTGEIQAHELAWVGDKLWIVNTLFSCLCTLDDRYSFVPCWRPPWITALAPEDRCHLNGLAVADGQLRFVTAMGETDRPGGWREDKVNTGCVVDVASAEVIARGLAMPHSPRCYAKELVLLDSGRGSLVRVNQQNGQIDTIARFPGYTRGLAIRDGFAFVGLSKIRETSTFGGVPIAENRDRLKCGVAVVNLASGELVGQFEFMDGVDEIFDVALLPSEGLTAVRGPFAFEEGDKPIWIVPSPEDRSSR